MRPVMVVASTDARRHALVKALQSADASLEVWPADLTRLTKADADALLLVNGAELARGAVRTVGRSARLLVMDDAPDAMDALRTLPVTTWGLVPARVAAGELLAALAAVDAGFIVLPSLASPLPRRVTSDSDGPVASQRSDVAAEAQGATELVADEPLTRRERQVLDLLVQGLSNRRIAAMLGISEHTVKFHVASIYGKLGARSRAQLVRRALGRGLVTL